MLALAAADDVPEALLEALLTAAYVVPAASVGANGSGLGQGPPFGPVVMLKVEEAFTGAASDQGVKEAWVV